MMLHCSKDRYIYSFSYYHSLLKKNVVYEVVIITAEESLTSPSRVQM